jgi:hypothetical protein
MEVLNLELFGLLQTFSYDLPVVQRSHDRLGSERTGIQIPIKAPISFRYF